MNTTQEQFFALLRSGMWKKPADENLFPTDNTDWETIFRIAKEQNVVAVTYDGIETLPKVARPPRNIYLTWGAQVARIEYSNRKLNERLVTLLAFYHEEGLHPVVLNGQGLSRNYPHSNHRQCSGIDIYVGKRGFNIANRILLEQGAIPEKEESSYCAGFNWDGVHIGNHRVLVRLNNPLADRYFRKLVTNWYPDKVYTIYLRGNPFPVPPAWFDALSILIDGFNHFLNGRMNVGLLCDWVCLLNLERLQIDICRVIPQLQEMELLKTAESFGYIAVNYLGLHKLQLPVSPTNGSELGEMLLKEMFCSETPGQPDNCVQSGPKAHWAGKWHTFREAIKRCRKLKPYAPKETFWYPFKLTENLIINGFRRKRIHKPDTKFRMKAQSRFMV